VHTACVRALEAPALPHANLTPCANRRLRVEAIEAVRALLALAVQPP
jgi:hypothetical protein